MRERIRRHGTLPWASAPIGTAAAVVTIAVFSVALIASAATATDAAEKQEIATSSILTRAADDVESTTLPTKDLVQERGSQVDLDLEDAKARQAAAAAAADDETATRTMAANNDKSDSLNEEPQPGDADKMSPSVLTTSPGSGTTAERDEVTTTTSTVAAPTCPPHTCRMLCPFGFVTDERGCAQCECRQPCADVQCPGGHECHVDDSACRPGEPCVPSTSCRQGKALGECAFGSPLTAPSGSVQRTVARPLLCGLAEGKPKCPSGYECTVPSDAEYGLCCPLQPNEAAHGSDVHHVPNESRVEPGTGDGNLANSVRAGECPLSVEADFRCEDRPACASDSECAAGQKCCATSCDTRRCLDARNATACEQQQRLATLFSENVEAPGYIPQCDSQGEFIPRQCSSNGKVCWCVNPAGQQVTGSIGPSDSVYCGRLPVARTVGVTQASVAGHSQGRAAFARAHRLKDNDDDANVDSSSKSSNDEELMKDERSSSHHSCSLLVCDVFCEYAYRVDPRTGCSLCECVDPCENNTCASDEECVIVKEEPCKDDSCQVSVSCSKKAPSGAMAPTGSHAALSWLCTSGQPELRQVQQQPTEEANGSAATMAGLVDVVRCADAHRCSDGFDCEIPSGHTMGICCQRAQLSQPPENTGAPKMSPEERRVVSDAMVVVVSNHRREQENSSEEQSDISMSSGGDDAVLLKTSAPQSEAAATTSVPSVPAEGGSALAAVPSPTPADAGSASASPGVVSTMCEYLRELGSRGEPLAVPTPVCNEDGRYSARQCDADGCFCVDDFGVEIRNSRHMFEANNNNNNNNNNNANANSTDSVSDDTTPNNNNNTSEAECRRMRSSKPCYNLLCRLGCDYGFDYDAEGCPLCACRSPCKNARCGPDQICQLAEPDAPCNHRWCPPVPKCVSKDAARKSLALICPYSVGELAPLIDPESREVVQCYTDSSREDACPSGHHCVPASEDAEHGFCCPNPPMSPSVPEAAAGHPERLDANQVSSASRWSPIEGRNEDRIKSGQCPYLIPLDTPVAAMSCEVQCGTDQQCPHDLKCCSNGCGTQCMAPVQMTGCEHARTIREHQMYAGQLLNTDNSVEIAAPTCGPISRAFEDVQCQGEFCWCADSTGLEIPGTRASGPPRVNCTAVRQAGEIQNATTSCDATTAASCNVDCEFGQVLDSKGCPSTCECVDPCEQLTCGMHEECRLVELACVTGPGQTCPRQALCRPRAENACPVGSPLRINDTLVTCGPSGTSCPTSHKCQLDIFGSFAQCCPKPREICFSAPPMCVEVGQEEPASVAERWFYNPMERQCQLFKYNDDYCQHGLNFFSSLEECEGICPTYTECELMREKTRTMIKNSATAAPVYVPKCNARLGTWEPLQCLHDLGLCWCVDQKGNQIPGSMVRGTPNCNDPASTRSGRSNLTPAAICPGGEPVHICDAEEVCGEKICAARSNATCRVDPCGGCKAIFFDEANNVVDCRKGLTACQEEAQQVVNSRAWTNQGLNTISNLVSALRELSEGMLHDEMAQSSRLFANPMEMMARQASSLIPMPHELLRRVRRSPKVVFDAATASHSRSKRETLSDEISDYDDPAARAMSAYHQNRRRVTTHEPIAEYSAPPKVVVPLRAPIIMVIHRRVVPRPPIVPSPLDLMQALSSTMPRMRIVVRLPTEPPAQHGVVMNEPIQQNMQKSRDEMTPFPEQPGSILPGGIDPALFMSHITSMMERVMGGEGGPSPVMPPPMAQPQASERIVVGPNFAEVKMTMKSETPVVPAVAMRHIEQGSLDTLLNYLFGPNQQVIRGVQPEREASSNVLSHVIAADKSQVRRQAECPRGGFAETILHSMVSGCRTECDSDNDCSTSEKCCRYGCSTTCVEPVFSDASENEHQVKPGSCPASSPLTPACLFPKVRCMEDGHCPADQKCCKGPCGATCQTPVDNDSTGANAAAAAEASMPPTMVVAPPMCSADGGYAVSQSQGQLSWCVDRYGEPIDSTLTKGQVACDVNGTVTKRESLGDICAKGQTPRVCRDECSRASCFAHPDAMCVADPCNNCAIHFVDAAGDKVDCGAVCDQKAFETAPCHANSGIRPRVRYTFNQTSQQCEQFSYECNGNDNNFESAQECTQQCKKAKSLCELPMERGLCMGAFMKWWYNPINARCEQFTYGGCGGNANNFETKAACEMRCPDLVLCPYDTITKEGLTREPCDRVRACAESTCTGDSNALCQVDPCDCRATWVDQESGEPARCDRPAAASTDGAGVGLATPDNFNEVVSAIVPKCRALQKKNAVIGHVYIPKCDADGAFVPLQCISLPSKKECWCVDAAGHQMGEPFTAGSKACASVKISHVNMDVAFATSESAADAVDMKQKATEFVEGLKRALRSVNADFSEVGVRMPNSEDPATAAADKGSDGSADVNRDSMTHAFFTLRGKNCAALAYKIEQLVMGKMLQIGDQIAEYKNSRFTYVAEEGEAGKSGGSSDGGDESDGQASRGQGRVEVIYSADRNEVLAVKRLLEPRTVDARTTTLAAAVLAVTVVMCILLLLTLLMHRRNKQKQLDGKDGVAGSSGDGAGSIPPGAVAFPNPVYALWTNRVMSAVCRRSPVPSPPKSPDHLARMEAQQGPNVGEIGIDSHLDFNDDIDNEFNNPSYEVFEDGSRSTDAAVAAASQNDASGSASSSSSALRLPPVANNSTTLHLNGRRPPTNGISKVI